MDMICNDDCIAALEKNSDGQQANEKEVIPALPDGIPVSFDYDGEHISLVGCNCTEKIEKPCDGVEIVTRTAEPIVGLTVSMVAKIYDGKVVDYIPYFENTREQNTAQISAVNAFDFTVETVNSGSVDMIPHFENPLYAMGDEQFPILRLMRGNEGCCHATLDEMAEENRTMRPGTVLDFNGRSCGERYSPYYIANWPDGSLVLAIGWSGLWRSHFEFNDNKLTVTAGLKRCNFYLKPGEKLRMPRFMFNVAHGEPEVGYNDFRRAYIGHVAPRDADNKIIFPPCSCPCPDENASNGPNEINWVKNVMDDTDAELYWHDAWWHKGGFPAGMGNYTFPIEDCVDHERYPDGVKILGDISHEKGYKFMLWFAPESYPPTSTMWAKHPEYLLFHKDDKGRATFNFANPEALDYITRYISECIQTYGVDIFRTDDGIAIHHIIDNEEEGREGVLEVQVVDGLYKFWDGLKENNPGLMIDNCCGGGTRLDLELCSRSYSLWRTDSSVWYHGLGDMIRHPILNQIINSSFNRFIPFTVCATCDYDPYTVRSGFNGGLTINMDLRRDTFDKAELRKAYAEVKRLRKYFTGDFYRLISEGLSPKAWCSYQYHVPENDTGCVFVFRRDLSPYSTADISLKGINPEKFYEVDFYRGYEKEKTVTISGWQLKSLTVELEGGHESLLLEYKERPGRINK